MRAVALCSGGKDSTYALWLAMRSGHQILEMVAMVPEREDSWMYHTANIRLIDLFGECSGIPVRKFTVKADEDERRALKEALGNSDADGVVSGVIASSFQKNAIDAVCAELGTTHIAPLWKRNPSELLRGIVDSGFVVLITLVAAEGLGPEWLGRTVDTKCVDDLEGISRKYGVHISGEGGEYESLVVDAPFFSKRIEVLECRKIWDEKKGRGIFEVTKAATVKKLSIQRR